MITSLGMVAGARAEDGTALDGEWKPIKAELAGKPMLDAVLKAITLKLDGSNYEVTITGEATDKGTCKRDAEAKPKGMTITGVSGPNQGKTIPAIYEFDGETLRVCYDLSGAKRPAEFKTQAGTQLYLVSYRRSKK